MRDFIGGDQINQSGPNPTGVQHNHAPAKPVRTTVLMLLSNPVDTPTLRLDEEHRAVDEAIQFAKHRDQIDLRPGMALRYTDLQRLLLRHEPTVVHYAGHSDRDGIALADHHGRARPVSAEALEELFRIVSDSVKCVVLNSCLSARQAEAIARHVPCVVGLTNRVVDPVAIDFAAGFHQALASGRTVRQAFDLGRNLPALGGLANDGPQLHSPTGAASWLTITG